MILSSRLVLSAALASASIPRATTSFEIMKIVVFGKGAVGGGLGRLMENKGHEVAYIDGRSGGSGAIDGKMVNDADMFLLAIPFHGVKSLASSSTELTAAVKGKIIMDATNPVKADWSPEIDFGVDDDEVKSGGEATQRFFPDARVVKVFHTVFADNFNPDRLALGDTKMTTFVAGNDSDARRSVMDLAAQIGFDPIETGDLYTARYTEAMAHLNIQLAVKMGRGTNTGLLYFDRK